MKLGDERFCKKEKVPESLIRCHMIFKSKVTVAVNIVCSESV